MLIANGFQGKEGQQIPTITEEFVQQISDRYVLLFEEITGMKFIKETQEDLNNRIFTNTIQFLQHV